MSEQKDGEIEHDFAFSEGDEVLVRVRENGTTGKIVAKFTAECKRIKTTSGFLGAKATFDLPGTLNNVTYASHEAEFEVVKNGR